jgi:hypothetical protein
LIAKVKGYSLPAVIFLVGNKSDIPKREVSTQDGEALAKELGMCIRRDVGKELQRCGEAFPRCCEGVADIAQSNGKYFKHPIKKHIWDILVKCKRLGDGGKITVQVPFDDEKGKFVWGDNNIPKKMATL